MPRTLGDSAKHTLAANLVAVRERVTLSQGDAARRAGVPQNRLSLWETAKETPGADGLLRLAVAYGCPLDDFFGGVDEGYDAIIERRVPVNVKQHYQARLDTFIRRTTAAMQLALEPGAPEPMPTAHAAARKTARGKSASARARRKSSK